MSPRDRILPPYTRRLDDTQHRILRLFGITSLVLFAMTMGFFIGVFGLFGWYIPAIPVVLMTLIALWIAPDVDTKLDGAIERSYFIFWGIALMWPPYIAFNYPGLPWISFARLSSLITCLLGLSALSMSPRLRGEMMNVLKSNKVLLRFFLAWVAIHVLMLLVGKGASAGRWTNQTLLWHCNFLIAAWVMTRHGNALRLNRLILIAAAVTALVTIPESLQQKPIWVDYIPSFLGIDPEIQEKLQFGAVRANEYRARSIFVVSLTYAEYIGMVLPFVLLAMVSAPAGWRRAAAAALLMLLAVAATLTQARSAMVAMLAGSIFFSAIWVFRRFQVTRKDQDFVSAVLLYGFPAVAMVVLSAAMLIPRIRVQLLGSGETSYSDNARGVQWDMAIPEILTNPIGHGMGSISRVIPYTNLAGEFTIDSYPINLLIEYGVPGFVAFVGFFATAIYLGIKTFVNAANKEEELAGAAAIGILTFLITRTILSSEGGQSMGFGFAGLILALRYRQLQRHASGSPPEVPPPPIPVRPILRPALQG